MKNKKRICILYTAAVMLCTLCGCQNGKTNEQPEAPKVSSLYEEGAALVSDMQALANDAAYIKLMSSATDIKQNIETVASCNYDKPSGVYSISNIKDVSKAALLISGLQNGSLSETADRYIQNSAGAQLANILIARFGGAHNLAASSVIMTSSCFYNPDCTEIKVYIYAYDDAYPVIVSFIPGKNGAVSARASCMLVDSVRGAGKDKINEFLGSSGYQDLYELEEITN